MRISDCSSDVCSSDLEVDHALAIEPVEAVAHRRDAHPEIVGETRGLDPGAARPFAGHQPALDRFIGRLEDMRGAHWPLLSAAANWETAPSWSGRRESLATLCGRNWSCRRTDGHWQS